MDDEAIMTRLRTHLEALYPGRGAALADRVRSLVSAAFPGREAGATLGAVSDATLGAVSREAGSATPDERDALLIAYADMLRRPGERPLETLAGFCERRLRGAFDRVHILPFYPSSSDEGFSVMDYRAVDPAFGTWDDVARVGRSFSPTFDLVLNHASVRGAWFRSFLAGERPYDRFFAARPPGYDASRVFRPRTHPLFTPFVRADGSTVLVWTTFSADQADLDYAEPDVFLAMADTLLCYLAKGARMLRLDAVAYAWKDDGTDCVDRPGAHLLVKALRDIVELSRTGALVLTETNLPAAANLSYFGDGDEAQLVYDFPLPPLVLHAFVSGNARPLAAYVAGTPAAAADRCFLNFLSSHDGIGVTPARGLLSDAELGRLADTVIARGGLVSMRATPDGPVPYELNVTWRDAVTDPADADQARATLSSHAIMLSLSGVPALYFHGLVGSRGWVAGPDVTGSKRSINRERLDADALEAELDDAGTERSRVFKGMLAMLTRRAEREAFAPASPQRVLSPDGRGAFIGDSRSVADGPLFGTLRGSGGRATLALANVSAAEARCALPDGFRPSGEPFDPAGDGRADRTRLDGSIVILPPRSAAWIDGVHEGGNPCT